MNKCSCNSHVTFLSPVHVTQIHLSPTPGWLYISEPGMFALRYLIYSAEMEWNFNVELPISSKAKFKPLIKLIRSS